MANVTVTLDKQLPGHEGPITEVVIREPSAEDYFEIGDPYVIARLEDGSMFPAEDKEAIKRYTQRLVKLDPLLLAKLSLKDAMQIKDAILGFFTAARSI